ncbi:MAG TPA: tetratricopeptide repeat protein [Candidatus Binatia bacterium]|jgi:tetratricopeptide (TPR) repeat protein
MKSAGLFGVLVVSSALFGCESEALRKQAEEIRRQEQEIARLRQENEKIDAAKQQEERKREACNVAFRSFEKAQAAKEPSEAVALYRDGLKLCPDDDVAHYELGKILAGMGRSREAQDEFEAALKINPNFQGARQELGKLQGK